jgi:hypothetical protein
VDAIQEVTGGSMAHIMGSGRPINPTFLDDIQKAIAILITAGAQEVYTYGASIADAMDPLDSLDLAVSGLPSGQFFSCIGHLQMELDHPADLTDLDGGSVEGQQLMETTELLKVYPKTMTVD